MDWLARVAPQPPVQQRGAAAGRTWSYSLPASSRLCWMANCSRSSSSSRVAASRWPPSTL